MGVYRWYTLTIHSSPNSSADTTILSWCCSGQLSHRTYHVISLEIILTSGEWRGYQFRFHCVFHLVRHAGV